MSRTIGSGGVELFDGKAAQLRQIAGELSRDINRWGVHLPVETIAEVVGRIERHLAEARAFEAIVLRARWPEEHIAPAHFAEAGDDCGHRVGG